MQRFFLVLTLLVMATILHGQDQGRVSIYCSLDQEFSEQLLDEFQKQTGILVEKVFDYEQSKTVGLVNKIISEETNPRCDVYWNNEVGQSVRLKNLGLLQPYISKNAASIPAAFKDPEGYWTGLAARARVLIYNQDLMAGMELPKSLFDLKDPQWAGKVTMARPLTGTTLTHAAALFALWGEEKTKAFFQELLRADIRWTQGNAMCMREVGTGAFFWGYTDTDDANVSRLKGKATDIIMPDQEAGGLGTLVIPNSVMIVKGAKNLANAKRLVDYILSVEVEAKLAAGRSAQIPLHPGVKVPAGVLRLDQIKAMEVDWNEVGIMIERHQDWLKRSFDIAAQPEGEAPQRSWPWVLGALLLLTFLVLLGRKSSS